MEWIYLFIASIFEIGWPIGIKMAQVSSNKLWWIIFAIVTMAFSGYFLYLAQKQVPLGTAYAIWTGIAVIGTFLIGVTVFHDNPSFARFLGVLLILSGVAVLKLFN